MTKNDTIGVLLINGLGKREGCTLRTDDKIQSVEKRSIKDFDVRFPREYVVMIYC
jgi:hypothetical protein